MRLRQTALVVVWSSDCFRSLLLTRPLAVYCIQSMRIAADLFFYKILVKNKSAAIDASFSHKFSPHRSQQFPSVKSNNPFSQIIAVFKSSLKEINYHSNSVWFVFSSVFIFICTQETRYILIRLDTFQEKTFCCKMPDHYIKVLHFTTKSLSKFKDSWRKLFVVKCQTPIQRSCILQQKVL